MPFGDPRPLRRRRQPLTSKVGPGQKATTTSRRPDCLKVAKTVADAVEMCPRIVNPLEVLIGARDVHLAMRTNEQSAIIDVLNREDGHEYQILVVRKAR